MDLLSAQRVLYTVSLPHLRFMKGEYPCVPRTINCLVILIEDLLVQ